MEQTIDIKKLTEEVIALKLEVAKMKEDFGFVRETEEAIEDIEEGRYEKMSPEKFLEEIRSFK